jgi:hypothetical protein
MRLAHARRATASSAGGSERLPGVGRRARSSSNAGAPAPGLRRLPSDARVSHKPVRKPVRQSVVGQQCSDRPALGWLPWDEAVNESVIRPYCPTGARAVVFHTFAQQPQMRKREWGRGPPSFCPTALSRLTRFAAVAGGSGDWPPGATCASPRWALRWSASPSLIPSRSNASWRPAFRIPRDASAGPRGPSAAPCRACRCCGARP